MRIELHKYQENCLKDLAEFFDKAAEKSPREAFNDIIDSRHRKYHPPPEMPDTPYVCIRIPTGGGKTLMAAHVVGIAAKHYPQTESPVCLWLAPSNAIVSQTLRSLQNRTHPCRIALADAFPGRSINCISIADALRISRADLDSGATVIVATIQSLRQEETEGRKVYDDNGNLMEHFDSIPAELQDNLRRGKDGIISQSLDNALNLRRPIIISDEAHNSGTELSYESLARFNPSCIVEFTATPEIENNPQKNVYASNVLTQASAFQLKNANMIKFPLHLDVINDPVEAIRAAIGKREELEKAAKKAGENIRPIVLYQAENKSGETTKEVIENALLNDFSIPREQIVTQTGDKKELQNIDLLSPNCPVRHIITVKALAEGWDCSFAYILCSMANFQSPRPVEQVLGRILRLPGASPKKTDALNRCYAYAANGNFSDIAKSLKDTLVRKNGFQQMEMDDFVSPSAATAPTPTPLFRQPTQPTAQPEKIKPFSVPLLTVAEKGEECPLQFEHFLDSQWSIAKEKPKVSDFTPLIMARKKGTMDIDERGIFFETEITGKIREQMMLLDADRKWTEASLAAWLDAEIPHPDIPQTQSAPYIYNAVKELCKKHDLSELARYRFYVRKFLERKIEELRRKKRREGYQLMLENMKVKAGDLQVSPKYALTFERGKYEPHWLCESDVPFDKHLHPVVGELKDNGEEWECARYLDELPEVETWVRNLDRNPNSFRLQTSTDNFYPDFVCKLTDGRILVVEYKGEDRWSNDDSKEKNAIGKIWAKLSGGKCLFVMPKGKDLAAIKKCINQNAAE